MYVCFTESNNFNESPEQSLCWQGLQLIVLPGFSAGEKWSCSKCEYKGTPVGVVWTLQQLWCSYKLYEDEKKRSVSYAYSLFAE